MNPDFCESGTGIQTYSTVPSCVSYKSDQSMPLYNHFNDGTISQERLLKSADAAEALRSLTNIVGKNPLLHTQLDLNKKTLQDVKVKNLSALLQDPHYRLHKLKLYKSVSDKSWSDVASALCTNPSHIRYLDLSWCELGDSGVKKLCDLLKKDECKLEKLGLYNSVNNKSWSDVASALCTNPSHIRYLDLSGCKLGDSGVEKLCDLLKKDECKLEKLWLINCSITDRGGSALTAALKLNSSHLKYLDLRCNKLGNSVRELEKILKCSGGELIHFQRELFLHWR